MAHPTLAPIVDAAVDRLAAAGLAVDLLANVEFAIADLPGAVLAAATGNMITIDLNAAGYGWYVDATPLDDSEVKSGSQLSTLDSRLRFDLLTVVMHELGHAAGLEERYDADELMFWSLEPGVRKTSLEASLADEAFADQ